MTPTDLARDLDRDAMRAKFRRWRTPLLYFVGVVTIGALALASIFILAVAVIAAKVLAVTF